MEEMTPCSLKDPEVFQRVWERVMAGRGEDSPIEPIPARLQGDLSCGCLDALAQAARACGGEAPAEPEPPVPDQPAPEPEPQTQEPQTQEPPAPESQTQEAPAQAAAGGKRLRESDLPRLWEEPREDPDRTARLRAQVMEALEGWQFYRHLARRARGNDARTLSAMAGELHRQARKLSAAYFLLTGLRYWPSELLSVPAIPSYWGALRRRHQAEQRQETAFRTAADDWDDPDLRELYQALVEGCQGRCRQLRALLEQDGT